MQPRASIMQLASEVITVGYITGSSEGKNVPLSSYQHALARFGTLRLSVAVTRQMLRKEGVSLTLIAS